METHAPAILDAVYEERVGYGWVDGEDDPSLDDLDLEIDPVGWC
jgi:hypothetical protein